ncbi:hypothetical protein [Limnohabitans sp.]|uniref:hypothetical protein n=1 Tax=Limnohabitans sp. TaxID=1907725 RepID=UPI002FDDAC62
MTMNLHILNHAGESQAVLNTRQKLTLREVADLAYLIQNPRFTLNENESEFLGVGVLSTFKDLNKISRFAESGLIKVEHTPRQLRGEELLTFLNKMSATAAPPTRPENLTPWSSSTCPIKVSSVAIEQITQAMRLKKQGVSYRKVASMTGIPFGSLQKVLAKAVDVVI